MSSDPRVAENRYLPIQGAQYEGTSHTGGVKRSWPARFSPDCLPFCSISHHRSHHYLGGQLRAADSLGPGTLIGDGLTHLGLQLQLVRNDTAAYLIGGLLRSWAACCCWAWRSRPALKNFVQRLFDMAMQRIPIVGSLYGTSKQLVTLFEKKDHVAKKLQGMKAGFCLFGEKSGVGLLALLVSPQQFAINGRNFYIVIVPTAPVPVGGGLFFVPVEAVQPTEVSVEALMSIYVSMGVSAPQYLPQPTAP